MTAMNADESVTPRQVLAEISKHLHQTLDLEELIPQILAEVNKAIHAEAQSLWLVDAKREQLVCRFSTGPGAERLKQVFVPLGQGIVGQTVATLMPVIIEDAQKDDRVYHGADKETGVVTRSLMSVPMVREGRAIGAIEAINKEDGALFSRLDLELFQYIADSAALSIENARLFADLRASYDSTLDALTAGLDLRDRETEGHSQRVVAYTGRLAEEMGLPPEQVAEFRRGAVIHDIGKLGVPDAVLHKPGPLDAEERKIIERHPRAGYEMLLGIQHLREEILIVLGHHERWDGAGYPLGLAGERIPLGARLFTIADTYDALTSDRPYRKGRDYATARAVIEAERGKQFDPAAVDAFLAVPAAEWAEIRARVMARLEARSAEQQERIRLALAALQGG